MTSHHVTTPRRLFTAHTAGLFNRTAPFWTGERAEHIVRARRKARSAAKELAARTRALKKAKQS